MAKDFSWKRPAAGVCEAVRSSASPSSSGQAALGVPPLTQSSGKARQGLEQPASVTEKSLQDRATAGAGETESQAAGQALSGPGQTVRNPKACWKTSNKIELRRDQVAARKQRQVAEDKEYG